MLSRGDERLVTRDPEIPALRIVLDPEAFLDWLRRQAPGTGLFDAAPQYVRYKPATSCLAAYAIGWSGGSLIFTGKAYRRPASAKLLKAERLGLRASAIGPGAFVDAELALVATVFPYDLKLKVLPRLLGQQQAEIIRHLLPMEAAGASSFRVLSYKPERRLVARVDGHGATVIVRAYTDAEYGAGAGQRLHGEPTLLPIARTLARHDRYPVVATEWLDGEAGQLAFAHPRLATMIGETLAGFHESSAGATVTRSADDDRRSLRDVARGLVDLAPKHAALLDNLSERLSDRLGRVAVEPVLTHGDFAARQVVVTSRGVMMTDLDEAATGHPGTDIGAFLADLDYRRLHGEVDAKNAENCAAAFLAGYMAVRSLPPGVETYHAAHLLRLAPLPFRTRQVNWPDQVERIIDRCDSLPWRDGPIHSATTPKAINSAAPGNNGGSAIDPAMPWLETALDCAHVESLFAHAPWAGPSAVVERARIRRHKPGRRCLIEYGVAGARHQTVIGKTRAKGLDRRTARLAETLCADGFGEQSADGIEVPPFLGVVPSLRMWLQAGVQGDSVADVLTRGNQQVAVRLIDAILKIQRLGPVASRVHTLADELDILEQRLGRVAARRPKWRLRLARLFEGCLMLAATVVEVPAVPSHRDLHPDQIIFDGSRLVLLDLDLYALGHPALDAANFIAHLIELGLQRPIAAGMFDDAGVAMHETMASVLAPDVRPALEVFTTLTLARLIEIDDRIEHRQPCVEPLIGLCEQRLSRMHALGKRSSVSRVLFAVQP